MEVHELLSVGMVILLGLLGGNLFHKLKIPKVTGYMLTGLVFGPSLIGLISEGTLSQVYMINEIALGLILFAIGGEIELHNLRAMGKKLIWISLAESAGAFAFVFIITFVLSSNFGLALLLGSIGIATAPGVTLLVIREYQTRGPLTDTLLAVVAINNVICLVCFRITFAFYSLANGDPMGSIMLQVFKELVVSVVIGVTIGGMITYWEQKLDDLSELLLIIIGGLLLGIGLARTIGISHLMVCLIIGAVTNNLSMMHRLVYAELRQTEMPFFIAFFVLSGASLHLSALAELGVLGVAYLVARPIGKAIGSFVAGTVSGTQKQISQNLGLALLPQAGVAIGLMMVVKESYAEMGEIISAVILSSIVVYEGIGPFLTKLALGRAGEIRAED